MDMFADGSDFTQAGRTSTPCHVLALHCTSVSCLLTSTLACRVACKALHKRVLEALA